MHLKNTLALAIVVFGLALPGCTKSSDKGSAPAPAAGDVSESGHVHGAWWCDEHGVPEEICAQCQTELAADFKAKGDWCQEHDRPDSQCFICHPEKQVEFAAQYEAKYGKQPPKPHVDGVEHEKHEHESKS